MRPFFIGLSISLGYSINPLVMAQHAGAKIQDRIHNFDFQKADIESLINLLLTNDKISTSEANDALDRLSELSDDEIKHITMDAFQNFKEAEISMISTTDEVVTSFYIDTEGGLDSFGEGNTNQIPKKSKKYQ